MSILTKMLLIFIKVYQKGMSPFIPARCRYYPTCSEYGSTAIKWHGARKGSYLLLARLSQCHPFGGSGIDFVPAPLDKFHFSYVSQCHYSPQFNGVADVCDTHASIDNNDFLKWIRFYQIPYRDRLSYGAFLNYLLQTSLFDQ